MKQTTHFSLPLAARAFSVLSLVGLAIVGVRAAALAEDALAPTLSDAINITDVAAEAESLIESNAQKLGSPDDYGKGKKLVARQAAAAAILAQAVALGKAEVAWKDRALEIRDAAMELAKASSYEEAQKAQAQIKTLLEGESQKMAQPLPWREIASLETIMKSVTKRNSLVRRPIRKTRFEKGKEAGARSAAVLAVLFSAARDDTHEVENKDDIPEWQQYSDEARDGMIELARIFKEGKYLDARKQFLAVTKTCKKCHAKFRPEP